MASTKALFLCVHNSARSRMAEAFLKKHGGGPVPAGTVCQAVVMVCSREAAERCPVFPGLSERHHWPFNEASRFKGNDEEIMAKVRTLRDHIEAAVKDFIAGHA